MQAAMWVLSGVIAAVVIFGPFRWYKGAAYDTADALLYAATHRTAWSLSLAWMTFACATGRGGLVDRFLSWTAFVPLSRLSFSAFLMQTVVILSRTLVTRERIHYSHTSMVRTIHARWPSTLSGLQKSNSSNLHTGGRHTDIYAVAGRI
ncbi:hypothetical protein V5799_022671 [Amblyomma americanum]|uniref:Uncharacterized protein n=1 Tax=Amblyomma americanum TaxID=6943 RepID=A0AAQ4FJQ3_AMBAM